MPKGTPQRAVTKSGTYISLGRTVGSQLFLHDEDVLRAEVPSVRNDRKAIGKPLGGFWTSSYDPDYGSGWVRWCVAHRYNEPLDLDWTVLSVDKSARVAVIESAADLAALIKCYPRTLRGRRGLDFEALSKEYDGLHLTNRGYSRTQSTRFGPALIGWDCESTVWLRWAFSDSHEVKPRFKDADRFDDLWLKLSGWTTEDYTCRLMPADEASKKVYETILRETFRDRDR
jgi:hypothetical protein